MCNCIQEVENDLVKKVGEYDGRKIEKVQIGNVVFPLDNLKIKGKVTTQPVELYLEGRKTPVKSSLSHRFCPWCGEDRREQREKSKETESEA